MEFKELIEKRRSIRKFSERAVPREVVDRILHETLSAPSARNTRTTHLVVVDEGLASCWVHINGRPRRKDEPGGETAAGYLRSFLPIPADCQPLCAVAAGYSDFTPAPLPGSDDDARIIRLE